MAKLTDRQVKKMIAYYVDCENYSATARKFGVSEATVRRRVKEDRQTTEKVEQEKKENIRSILQHMAEQRGKVEGTIDRLLDALSDPEKIKKASLRDIATSLGILIDKYSAPDINAGAEDDSGRKAFLEAMGQKAVEVWNAAAKKSAQE